MALSDETGARPGQTSMQNGHQRPIFLVGTGRCGSTIIYSCLAMHPDFAWIPSWVTVATRWPALGGVNRLWAIPGSDRFRETRFFPKPVEPNPVFEAWDPHYREEGSDPASLASAREGLVPLVARLCQAQGKRRFLAKMVGRPVKIEVLNALFPDALFILITRDLRPTTCSLIQVEFYHGVDLSRWPWNPIPAPLLEFAAARSPAPEVDAAIVVEMNLRELRRQLALVPPARVLEMGYGDFIAQPEAGLERLGAWAGFTVDSQLLGRVRKRKLYGGADQKWMKFFTPAQQKNLNDFEALARSTR